MVKLATETDAALAALYDEMKGRGAAGLRKAAWTAFSRKGLPNRRVESWHYTDLTPVLPPALGLRLVTLDGVFRPDLSDLAALPESVKVQSLSEALAQGEPAIMSLLASDDIVNDDTLVSLNAALMQDGAPRLNAPSSWRASSPATPRNRASRARSSFWAGTRRRPSSKRRARSAPARRRTIRP